MSKPKNKKSGSKSKKRIPARKKRPTCGNCHKVLHLYSDIERGYCEACLLNPFALSLEDLVERNQRSKR